MKITLRLKPKPKLYWNDKKADGTRTQRTLYWGDLPMKKLKKLLKVQDMTAAQRKSYLCKCNWAKGGGFDDLSVFQTIRTRIEYLKKEEIEERAKRRLAHKTKVDLAGENSRGRNPQKSHEITPVTLFYTTFSKAKFSLEKRLSELKTWDEGTRTTLRAEIERHERWLVGLKGKL